MPRAVILHDPANAIGIGEHNLSVGGPCQTARAVAASRADATEGVRVGQRSDRNARANGERHCGKRDSWISRECVIVTQIVREALNDCPGMRDFQNLMAAGDSRDGSSAVTTKPRPVGSHTMLSTYCQPAMVIRSAPCAIDGRRR